MLGMVRLYIDPRPDLPDDCIPTDYQPVIECTPDEVPTIRKTLRRQGYEVTAVPL